MAQSHKVEIVACDTGGVTDSRRYDEIAAWYDEYVRGDKADTTRLVGETLVKLLGLGPGRCLDLGCGGGVHISALEDARWTVVGVDESAEQLRVARERVGERIDLIKADAHALPFPDASFDAVAAAFMHTDVNDVGLVFTEAARVLRGGGRFVHVGTPPCVVAPSVELVEGGRLPRSGYRREGWTREGAGMGAGIRTRVAVYHVTLAGLLNAVASAGLVLDRALEPEDEDPPPLFALAATKRP